MEMTISKEKYADRFSMSTKEEKEKHWFKTNVIVKSVGGSTTK
jgi:hypothetical protein